MTAQLSISGLSKTYPNGTRALKGISLDVPPGMFGLLGRNGAGKTSIFKLITGELQPTVGSVARKPGLRHALLDQHRETSGRGLVDGPVRAVDVDHRGAEAVELAAHPGEVCPAKWEEGGATLTPSLDLVGKI